MGEKIARDASVTILILNYNQGRFLDQAMKSVLEQSRKPDQLLFIDDGSNLDIYELNLFIKKHSSSFSNVIDDKQNRGHTYRMNQALGLATSKHLLLLSADDWLEPQALETLLSVSTENDVVIFGNLNVCTEDVGTVKYIRPRETWQGKTARKYLHGSNPFGDILKVNNFVSGGMSLISVEALREFNGWDENVTTEDLDLWLRMGQTKTFKYVDQIIGNYRKVEGSKSRSDTGKLLDHSLIFSKHVGSGFATDIRLAYLASMRWALTVARSGRLPDVSLHRMGKVIGLHPCYLYIVLPWAAMRPIVGSVGNVFRVLRRQFFKV